MNKNNNIRTYEVIPFIRSRKDIIDNFDKK